MFLFNSLFQYLFSGPSYVEAFVKHFEQPPTSLPAGNNKTGTAIKQQHCLWMSFRHTCRQPSRSTWEKLIFCTMPWIQNTAREAGVGLPALMTLSPARDRKWSHRGREVAQCIVDDAQPLTSRRGTLWRRPWGVFLSWNLSEHHYV